MAAPTVFLHEQVAQASPDLLRQMTAFINALPSAHDRARTDRIDYTGCVTLA